MVRTWAEGTKAITMAQLVQLIRGAWEVIPQGPNQTMGKAKLMKLRKQYRTKTAA
ncbi:hypothetical protein O164_14170 [Pseudomonas taiwanensis SJ9]|uniref:Uncharacterized protein n=1 Tax=Pseudomonas taiwanensis SJ9 TaxID=1388762 RepID=V7DCV9_9PSED|nr:hypothetical protein O164_14170 [Pseudomonas taiwanensis SJ9]